VAVTPPSLRTSLPVANPASGAADGERLRPRRTDRGQERRGATGKVRLRFEAKVTNFSDLAEWDYTVDYD